MRGDVTLARSARDVPRSERASEWWEYIIVYARGRGGEGERKTRSVYCDLVPIEWEMRAGDDLWGRVIYINNVGVMGEREEFFRAQRRVSSVLARKCDILF